MKTQDFFLHHQKTSASGLHFFNIYNAEDTKTRLNQLGTMVLKNEKAKVEWFSKIERAGTG